MTTGLARAGARGGITVLLGQGVMFAVRIVALIVLARLVLPEVFGLVAIVTAIAAFANAVLAFGLPMAATQAKLLSSKAQSTLFLVNTGLGLIMGAVLFTLAGPLASVYDDPRLEPIVRWVALVPLLTGLVVQSRVHLMRCLRFSLIVVAEVVALLIGAGAAIALAYQGADLMAVVILQVVPVALQCVTVMMFARWLPGAPGALREVGGLLRIGLRILGMNVLKNGSGNVIVPVTGLFVPTAALGNFDRAQHLVIAPINLTVDQMQRVAVPVLSRLRDDPARMLAYMRRAQLLGAYGTATLFAVVAALGGPIIRILLGAGWDLAGTVTQILAVGAMCRSLGQAMQWIFISADATREGLRLNLWTQPSIAVLSLLGLPWGVIGVAVMNSVAWALLWPTATIFAARVAKFPAGSLLVGPARALILFGVPVGGSAAIPCFLDLDDWLTVLLGFGLAACAGLASWWAFRRVREDLRALAATARLALSRRADLYERD